MSSKPYFHLTIYNGGVFLQDFVDGVVKIRE